MSLPSLSSAAEDGKSPPANSLLAPQKPIAPGSIEISEPPSIDKLKAEVAAGSPRAMWALAERYLEGKETELNVAEAHRLIDQSIAIGKAAGDPYAAMGPACVGVCQVFFSALPWELPVSDAYQFEGPDPAALRAHADRGDARSMTALADAYWDGRYFWALQEDREQANYWYGRAAAAGDKGALMTLGRLNGTSDQALAFYKRAAAAHAEGAAKAMAELYDARGQAGDAERSTAQWLVAARQGDADAMDRLSRRYADGKGTRTNAAAAKLWCDRATKALASEERSPTSNLGMTIVRSARLPDCFTPRPPPASFIIRGAG